MSDINTDPVGNLAPSLQMGSISGSRYANPFFDLSQQYMPPTIKELFRWCTFYYYNSPLIGSAITKISRYPITNLIFEDDKESVRNLWSTILNKYIKITDRLMEINLDYHVYGNAFMSVHLPFTRHLVCKSCKHNAPINQWDWNFNSGHYSFNGVCKECGTGGPVEVKDVPYKDIRGIKLIRWSPENISIKRNEYTGRTIYMYSIPYKLKAAIQRGDKDILEDMPLIVIQALKERRMIRFSADNFLHLKRPTLAEQDMGWGKPVIIHVLKDMYYFYTLRRAQEAIANEHIVPFDIIYPMPNAQQDPYVHTNLSSWRVQIESIIKKHRRDPNFKGVIPIPVGFGRLGGDGKAMLLTPELNYITQTVVGGMGIPQEFLFGGLNFTGSSISLRTLENDFIQNRSQLSDAVIWLKDKIRIWMNYPDCGKMHFADFRMADDVQRNQQLIGLNAQMKVSDQTMLTELGYNWELEQRKMLEEIYFQNYVNDLRAKANAKSQGEAGIIQYNYQQKVQDLAQKAQDEARKKIDQSMKGVLPTADADSMAVDNSAETQLAPQAQQQTGAQAQPAQAQAQAQPAQAQPASGDPGIDSRVKSWAGQLAKMQPQDASQTLMNIKSKLPDIGALVEQAYNEHIQGAVQGNMTKAPESAKATGMS